MSALLPWVTIALCVVILAGIATAALGFMRVPAPWSVVTAVARAAVQLALLSLVLTGIIRDASYLGVSTQYQVESKGGTLTVYEQNVERATRAELWTRGDQVQITWSPDHSFVVPADGDGAADEASVAAQPAAAGQA